MADRTHLITATLRTAEYQGWVLSDGQRGGEWYLSRNGETLYVSVNSHWLCFTLPLLTLAAPDVVLYRYLLQFCHRCFMGKYGLGRGRQVLLQIEIPLAGLEHRYCHQAIEAVQVYAGRFHEAISRVTGGLRGMVAIGRGHREMPPAGEMEKEIFSLKTLALYFKTVEHLGWHLRDRLTANHWHVIYETQERKFDVFLSFNRSWAYFQIPMLADVGFWQAQSEAHQIAFYSYLLQLNEHIYWAKFGMDEEGQALLMLELPVEAFDLQRFRRAVQTLAAYATDYAYEVQIMAHLDRDTHLATLLANEG